MQFTIDGLNELGGIINLLIQDMYSLKILEQNAYFIERLKLIVAENFSSVWNSEGSIINESWKGRDLVDTGNLRSSLTNARRLKLTQVGSLIIVSSEVSYAEWVNDDYKFYGISSESQQKLTSLIGEYLKANGNINWE